MDTQIWEWQQYNFSIGILAMLLLGFGFLMVFVKKNGFSALTGTYLVVAGTLPVYMLLKAAGILTEESMPADSIETVLFAEFMAASALISMGAVLGRLRLFQYLLFSVVMVPFYMLTEWLVTEGALGVTRGFVDTAGSVQIHAFGAYFGLAMTLVITTKKHKETAIESDATSDRFSLVGSMILWVFWPGFCSAIVEPELFQRTAVNTILALCGATVATFLLSSALRKGKTNIADIANAVLAGGVSIGSTCNIVQPAVAFAIGICAGLLCTLGFVVIQGALEKKLGLVDTCGVHNLHGMPGLLGGLIAIAVVPSAAVPQIVGILVAVGIALAGGFICGGIIKATGSKQAAYDDAEEFAE
ncbi:MAG: ammonium transporter [Clostridiales Family XIII bacterium]|nr:ammonium transporter [Clostridiales Family XIII bacterium]